MLNDEHQDWRHREVCSNRTVLSARATRAGVVDLDVSWLVPADLTALEALARLQVAASRCGRRLVLHRANGGLVELLEFAGLDDVLHLCWCCRRCVRY